MGGIGFLFLTLGWRALAMDCRYDALAPVSLADKSLTIIASDHEKDVYDRTLRLLEEARPDLVSLEQFVSPHRTGKPYDEKAAARYRETLLSGEGRYTVEIRGKTVVLRMGDLILFDGTRDLWSETNAGITYAVREGKPFYFTDWGHDFPNVMFGFVGGKIIPLRLEGKTTYQNFPNEYATGRDGAPSLTVGNVQARNRYTADGLRQLYRTHGAIAHIGGTQHFRSLYPWEIPLQALAPAGRQQVHFLAGEY